MPATESQSRRPPRRSQQERSAETRAKLLDATVDCLYRYGYAGASTTLICEKAGVSRGAQLHHFPTKAELVTTAVEHLFDKRRADFREAMAELPEGEDRADAALDFLWQAFSGPTFYAWLELIVAARTDPDLAPAVAETTNRFNDAFHATFAETFPEVHASELGEVIPEFTMFVLDGMAISRIAHGDVDRGEKVLALFKTLGRLIAPMGDGASTAPAARTQTKRGVT
jgi:AcrR family transcriptional regulator